MLTALDLDLTGKLVTQCSSTLTASNLHVQNLFKFDTCITYFTFMNTYIKVGMAFFFLESSIGFRSLKSNKLQTDSTPPHTLELNPLSNPCLFYGGRSI